jgi:hypothetical protein
MTTAFVKSRLLKLTIFIVMILISAASFAGNPQIRTCRLNNSQFWTLNITEPKSDRIGFCRNGDSLLGSISVMQFVHYEIETDAVVAFKSTRSGETSTCEDVGAEHIVAIENQTGKAWDLCAFSDYSFISLNTLITGWNAVQNSNLREILRK